MTVKISRPMVPVKCDCTKFYLLGKHIEDPMKPKNCQIWRRGIVQGKALLKKIQGTHRGKKHVLGHKHIPNTEKNTHRVTGLAIPTLKR